MSTVKGKQIPVCKCKDIYTGHTCNKCKDSSMQFPGCHTLKTPELYSETMMEQAARFQSARNDMLVQKCINAIPPTLDTFEDLKFDGQAKLAGVFSLSEINNEIDIGRLAKSSNAYTKCLFGNVSPL